jgi:SAM-dependent methyltransferase
MNNEMQLSLTNEQERRRQYLVSFKQFANLALPEKVRKLSHDKHELALEAELNRPLEQTDRDDRHRLAERLTQEPLFKAWETMTFVSQTMMWDLVSDIVVADLPRLTESAERLDRANAAGGSLELNPDIEQPPTIADYEIHRQPGGFNYEHGEDDLTAGAFYAGASLVYGPGKRVNGPVGYGAGDFVADEVKQRFPDFKPKTILDVGCGAGRNTLAFPNAFPDAEITAIDCAPGLLRYGHANAESAGAAVHFRQMNAEQMDFEDESFDLVVSTILGHETSPEGLPKITAECWRVLKPGGVILHQDVPTQVWRLGLADQIMNEWQVEHNGEPFWMGWAEADLIAIMKAAGYPEEHCFAEHAGNGPVWFVHGGSKPA